MERRILVYAPIGQDAALTEKIFQSASIEVAVCKSDLDLAARLGEGAAAVLLVEEAMSKSTLGVLHRYIEEQEQWSDLPVLLLTKRGADSPDVRRAIDQLGNVTLLERPVRTNALVSSARSALRARERQYQVRALDKRKDEFLATLAHELRNPLSPILNATTLFERFHPSENTTRLTAMVRRQIGHLTRLIDDLMDVARITSGKLQLQRERSTIKDIVTQAIEISAESVDKRKHRFGVTLPESNDEVFADRIRLVQILANVIVNAAKFTPVGGEIQLTVEVDAPDVTFTVTDSGRGLSATETESIFEMFSQSRAMGEPSTGLGMGLHLARVLAEMHAGSITATSEGKGKGSTFVISVPIAVPDEVQILVERGKAEFVGGRELPETVLVVDDNEDAANTLGTLLSDAGIKTTVVYDGKSAVESTSASRPEVVVMDIGMKPMNGYEAARLIRAQAVSRDGKGPTLIALTGWGQYADRALALEVGFDHHFVKPIDVQKLLKCLAEIAQANKVE